MSVKLYQKVFFKVEIIKRLRVAAMLRMPMKEEEPFSVNGVKYPFWLIISGNMWNTMSSVEILFTHSGHIF